MPKNNRFSGVPKLSEVKEQMAENLQSKNNVEDTDSFEDNTQNLSTPDDNKSKKLPPSLPAPEYNVTPMTRKTTTMPLLLDLAVKELKNRRNLARKFANKGTSKTTEDDIVIEALNYFFKQSGEINDCLTAAKSQIQTFG